MSNRKEYELLLNLRASLGSDFKNAFKEADSTMKTLKSAMGDTNGASRKIDGYQKAEKAVEKTKEQLKKYTDEHESLKKKMQETAQPAEELKQKFKESEDRIKRTTESVEKQEARLRDLKTELRNAGIDTNNLTSENDRLRKSYEDLKSSKRYIEEITTAQEKNKKAVSETQGLLLGVIGTYAAAGTAYYKAFVEPSANFEEQMSTVKAISGSSNADMEYLTKLAKETGAATKFTAVEAGQALEYMGMAGWKTEQMIGGLPGIVNLAAASGEDLAMVSDIVTDALTAFNLKAEDSAHFADILAAAATNSNTNVAMMGESFKYAAPLAGAFGFAVEDTAVLLGLMANSGIKSSQAGTTLKRIFSEMTGEIVQDEKKIESYEKKLYNLNKKLESQQHKVNTSKKPTDTQLYNLEETKKEIQEVGGALEELKKGYKISTTNEDGTMRSLKEIIDDARTAFNGLSEDEIKSIQKNLTEAAKEYGIELEKSDGTLKTQLELYEEVMSAVDGMTEAGKVREAEAIAGKYAMAGLLSIINSSEEDYNKLTEAVYNCNGAAKEMADIRLDNLKGDITIAKSAWEGFAITMGDLPKEDLRNIVQNVTELINQANRWVQANPETIKQIAGIVIEIGKWTAGGLGALYAGQKLQGGFLGIAKACGKVNAAFKAANVAQEGKKFNAFASALSPLTKGIGIYTGIAAGAVVITAAVAAGIYYLHQEAKKADLAKRFGEISLSLEEIGDAAKRIVWNETLEQLSGAFNSFKELKNIAGDIQAAKDEINKINWKVGIGLELTESEQQNYINSISDYVGGLQEYVNTQGYSIHVALSALFNAKDELYGNLDTASSNVTVSMSKKLKVLGTELSEYVAEAFSDGIFDINEQKAAIELQRKIAEIERIVTESNYQAKYDVLEMEMGAAGLTAESAKELQKRMSELAIEGMEMSKDTIYNTLAEYRSQIGQAQWLYDNSNNPIEKTENLNLLEKITNAYKEFKNQNFSNLYAKPLIDSIEFQFKTLENTFPDFTEIYKSINNEIESVKKEFETGFINENEYFYKLDEVFINHKNEYIKFTNAEKSNFNDYLSGIKSTVTELEKITEGMEEVPEDIQGLIDYFSGLSSLQKLQLDLISTPGLMYDETGGEGKKSYWGKKISAYAGGTDYSARDFIAGENGPELITDAPGMKVYTAEETANLISSYKQIVMFLPAFKAAARTYSPPPIKSSEARSNNSDTNVTINLTSPVYHLQNGLSDDAINRINALNDEFADRVRQIVKDDYTNDRRVRFKK